VNRAGPGTAGLKQSGTIWCNNVWLIT